MPGLNYLGEALADVGGINASLTAYRKIAKKLDEPQLPGLTHLSNEQLFFLAEANVWCINTNIIDLKSKLFKEWPSFFSHPPNYYRVILPAMNSPDFAKAFNCKAGSKMNPKNKCRMW
jgi:endothelin-converting enzyme